MTACNTAAIMHSSVARLAIVIAQFQKLAFPEVRILVGNHKKAT